VQSGYARYALSGAYDGLLDANGIIMRDDFIQKNRPAAVAWLKANIEALYFMHDNPVETVNVLKREMPDLTKENIWAAFYGQMPPSTGAGPVVNTAVMIINPEDRALAASVFAFLKTANVVQGELGPDALDPTVAAQAFTELGLDPKKALFEIKGAPVSENPFDHDDFKKK
jgi:NitT/TauT family transport system substrate-binding protein